MAGGLSLAGLWGALSGHAMGDGPPAVAANQAATNAAMESPVAAPVAKRVAAAPRFTAKGELVKPEGVERWILAGASLGLDYSDSPARAGGAPGRFHNVYVEPGAYAAFLRTGAFPQGTLLAMTVYEPEERIPPQRHGYVEGELVGLEVAVKDSARFEEGWAYFGFAQDAERGFEGTARAFPAAACFACHRAHAARDNVFTQFYPLLRGGETP